VPVRRFGVAGATTQINELGTAIALGVLLDTFFVRTRLVPAIAILCGRYNRWPSKLARATPQVPDPSRRPRARSVKTWRCGTAPRAVTMTPHRSRRPGQNRQLCAARPLLSSIDGASPARRRPRDQPVAQVDGPHGPVRCTTPC